MNPKISIIIPVFNEDQVIKNCIDSLTDQTYDSLEIIIVDDGSTDKTPAIIKSLQSSQSHIKLLKQNHQGPGSARNLGSSKSSGEILVFVDADMTFDKNFIKDLVDPIKKGKTIGTFSKNELVSNTENIWSNCWSINKNLPKDRMIPLNYPNESPVFRAILKKEFERVDGFETTGEYTDDWSLSEKLNLKATLAKGAIYYHTNPSSIVEIYKQARWIGKNRFISGDSLRITRSIILYSFPISLIVGIYKSILRKNLQFIFFKLVYDTAIFVSCIRSFFKEAKFK